MYCASLIVSLHKFCSNYSITIKFDIMENIESCKGEIVMYQPDETIRLEVRMGEDTVWLSANQMACLFERDEKTIRKHINNVFSDEEVPKDINTHFLRVDGVKQPVAFYTLDVIISVGYRVKSKRGTAFRQWANKVLKEYLLQGYSINHNLKEVQNQLGTHDKRINALEEKVSFFVRSSLPPVEGIFYDGQIFDAYAQIVSMIKQAKQSIVLVDNYVDETTLTMLSKRGANVSATIYTKQTAQQFQLDVQRHNQQYPPITIHACQRNHDRFLIIDDVVYLFGASLKDAGKKLFAYIQMQETSAADLLNWIR